MRDTLSGVTDARAPLVRPGFVVYTGQSVAPLGDGVVALPLPFL